MEVLKQDSLKKIVGGYTLIEYAIFAGSVAMIANGGDTGTLIDAFGIDAIKHLADQVYNGEFNELGVDGTDMHAASVGQLYQSLSNFTS